MITRLDFCLQICETKLVKAITKFEIEDNINKIMVTQERPLVTREHIAQFFKRFLPFTLPGFQNAETNN